MTIVCLWGWRYDVALHSIWAIQHGYACRFSLWEKSKVCLKLWVHNVKKCRWKHFRQLKTGFCLFGGRFGALFEFFVSLILCKQEGGSRTCVTVQCLSAPHAQTSFGVPPFPSPPLRNARLKQHRLTRGQLLKKGVWLLEKVEVSKEFDTPQWPPSLRSLKKSVAVKLKVDDLIIILLMLPCLPKFVSNAQGQLTWPHVVCVASGPSLQTASQISPSPHHLSKSKINPPFDSGCHTCFAPFSGDSLLSCRRVFKILSCNLTICCQPGRFRAWLIRYILLSHPISLNDSADDTTDGQSHHITSSSSSPGEERYHWSSNLQEESDIKMFTNDPKLNPRFPSPLSFDGFKPSCIEWSEELLTYLSVTGYQEFCSYPSCGYWSPGRHHQESVHRTWRCSCKDRRRDQEQRARERGSRIKCSRQNRSRSRNKAHQRNHSTQ